MTLFTKGRCFPSRELLMTWALSAMDRFHCTLPGRAPDVQPLRHNVEVVEPYLDLEGAGR